MSKSLAVEIIAAKIVEIRGKKVMLDDDLAGLYGVATKNLNKAVKRNSERFPADFMYQLTREEVRSLRFQFGTSKKGGRRYLPYAFTQEGVAMLSSVLNSKRAIQVNIAIMRAFVKLRNILATYKRLACKLKELGKRIENHDKEIKSIFEAIRQLMAPVPGKKRIIEGFRA
jgi:phage regulator Rha-like protein